MISRGGLMVFKQHRFEIAAALLLSLAVGVWALVIGIQLDGLGTPPACIDNWLGRVDGPDGSGPCAAPMHAYGGVLNGASAILAAEGALPISVMGLLPFAVGLLGGVPIVAGELEARTAQTAWSLSNSRTHWLMRQVGPVAVAIGLAIAFAAIMTGGIVAADVAWGHSAFTNIGLYGPLAVVRALSALGLGLVVGALLGRTLPAFVLGTALALAILFAANMARDSWLQTLEPQPIAHVAPATGEMVLVPRSVPTGWGWITPDGDLLSLEDALLRVPSEIVANDDPIQYVDSGLWLEEHGYIGQPLGITQERAMGWQPFDGLIFGAVGLVSAIGTVWLVNRRRPA